MKREIEVSARPEVPGAHPPLSVPVEVTPDGLVWLSVANERDAYKAERDALRLLVDQLELEKAALVVAFSDRAALVAELREGLAVYERWQRDRAAVATLEKGPA